MGNSDWSEDGKAPFKWGEIGAMASRRRPSGPELIVSEMTVENVVS